jgi:hypothetical protein
MCTNFSKGADSKVKFDERTNLGILVISKLLNKKIKTLKYKTEFPTVTALLVSELIKYFN